MLMEQGGFLIEEGLPSCYCSDPFKFFLAYSFHAGFHGLAVYDKEVGFLFAEDILQGIHGATQTDDVCSCNDGAKHDHVGYAAVA